MSVNEAKSVLKFADDELVVAARDGKLIETNENDEKMISELDDKTALSSTTATDSGFISSGNLIISSDDINNSSSSTDHHLNNKKNSDKNSSEEKGKSTSMHIVDSGVITTSHNTELSLSDKISKLKLTSGGLNDLNAKKQQQKQQSVPTIIPPVFGPDGELDPDYLWKRYSEQNQDGDTNLHITILYAPTNISLVLIRGAPHPRLLDTTNDDGCTPLHFAVKLSSYNVIRGLIVAGANPCIRDRKGDSPLHIAVRLGDQTCVQALLEPIERWEIEAMDFINQQAASYRTHRKCDLEQWNYTGKTCVHIAAIYRRLPILKYLVKCGANINSREGLSGYTALHYAVENNDEAMVKYLINECESIEPETLTYGGQNPLQISPMFCNSICANRIRETLEFAGLDPPYYIDSDDNEDDEYEMDEGVVETEEKMI